MPVTHISTSFKLRGKQGHAVQENQGSGSKSLIHIGLNEEPKGTGKTVNLLTSQLEYY